jgi:hypothetical protein
MDVLPKRFGKYGLTLHPDKTRLIEFRRPKSGPPSGGNGTGPGTFDLLGFTHFWCKSRKGKWVIKQRTALDRFQRALKRIAEWCRRHRHDKVREQQKALNRKLNGHYEYFGIKGNSKALSNLRWWATTAWRKWLNRRSQRRSMTWERMKLLLKRYPLQPPRIYPRQLLLRAVNP